MEVHVASTRRPRPGRDDPTTKANGQLLRLTAVLDEPFAELADADRELRGIRVPLWATPFQKQVFGQLRVAYRDAVHLQSIARTTCRGPEDENHWIDVLEQARERFEDAANLYWRLFPSIAP